MTTDWLNLNQPRLSNQFTALARDVQWAAQDVHAALIVLPSVQELGALLGIAPDAEESAEAPATEDAPATTVVSFPSPRTARLRVRQGRLITEVKRVGSALGEQAAAVDLRYQQWIHDTLDPLLGRERYEQLRLLSGGRAENLSYSQKNANHLLAWGTSAALITATAMVAGLPVGGLSLGFGLVFMAPTFGIAYKRLVVEHRLSYIHLAMLYGFGIYATGNLAAGALGMLIGGVGIKVIAQSEAVMHNQVVRLVGTQPRTVWQVVDGIEREIPFAQVQRDDVLIFHAGQTIPVDGVVVEGAAAVDQHMLTGEAQPAEKGPGDAVLAATVVLSGRILVQVQAAGATTTAAHIAEILNTTASHRLSIAEKIIATADRSLPFALGLVGTAFVLQGPTSALAIIGSNYLPTMAAATPFTLVRYLNYSANEGILVKDGEALEKLHQVNTVVFDKTGTLTMAQPQVTQIHAHDAHTKTEALRLAAAAEQRQTHPIAHAILAAAHAQGLRIPSVETASYEVGYGLQVTLSADEGGQHLYVGSERFMTQVGIERPASFDAAVAQSAERGTALVWVACNGAILGALELAATVRPEAQQLVHQLQQRGVQCYIISGDQEPPTRWLAQELGMDGYFANTLPHQKAELVERLKAEGRMVCFIGDGINDAIALKKADIGVSLAGAHSAATDTAQIVLMHADLRQLMNMFTLVEAMNQTIERNFTSFAIFSALSASSVLFFGAGFVATELFYSGAVLSALYITTRAPKTLQATPDQAQPMLVDTQTPLQSNQVLLG